MGEADTVYGDYLATREIRLSAQKRAHSRTDVRRGETRLRDIDAWCQT